MQAYQHYCITNPFAATFLRLSREYSPDVISKYCSLLRWIETRGGRHFCIKVRNFFKFENPIPVQNPATIDPT